MAEGKRQVYKCSKCEGTEFIQRIKGEHDNRYDSVKHVIKVGHRMSIGSGWKCVGCNTEIFLDLLHGIFRDATLDMDVGFDKALIRNCRDYTGTEEEYLRTGCDLCDNLKWINGYDVEADTHLCKINIHTEIELIPFKKVKIGER